MQVSLDFFGLFIYSIYNFANYNIRPKVQYIWPKLLGQKDYTVSINNGIKLSGLNSKNCTACLFDILGLQPHGLNDGNADKLANYTSLITLFNLD